MQTTAPVRGLICTACGDAVGEIVDRCPDCDGLLTVDYDPEKIDAATDCRPFAEQVTLDEGETPLITVPELADELGLGSVAIKDEGRNPTGSLADRKFAVAVRAALEVGPDRVGTPSTGNGAQSAAAYAARAQLDSKGFVPSRCPFLNKAMVNVHGGDMYVVEGRYADAVEAFKESDEEFTAIAPGHPFRIVGGTVLALELLEDRKWDVPDAVVHPTGHGETLVGLQRGFALAVAADLVTETPRLYAVQPADAAPIAEAARAGDDEPTPVDHPDTIVGPLEVPAPAAGTAAIESIAKSGGNGVVVTDKELLQGAVDGCEMGPEVGATGGTAIAGVRTLAETDTLEADADVVLINPVAGSKEADLLRSHLMSKGL